MVDAGDGAVQQFDRFGSLRFNQQKRFGGIDFSRADAQQTAFGRANLHKMDGLAVKTVLLGGQPSANNIKDMKAALKNKNKQWTGGWIAFSDPLNGYL